MQYLALQIAIFLLIATISGIALGWWIKGMIVKVQLEDIKNQNVSNRRNLKDTREQLSVLQAKNEHAQQQIDKYSAHYNSNTYGQYLEARKSLEVTRKNYEALLAELNQQKALNKKLEHQISVNSEITHSHDFKRELLSSTKSIEIDVEEDYFSDDLKKISGITPDMEKQLNSLGILKYRQIAEFSLQDAEMISGHLSSSSLPDYSFMVSTARGLHSKKYNHQAA